MNFSIYWLTEQSDSNSTMLILDVELEGVNIC